MKKTIWLMGLALLGMVVLGACSDKKTSKNVDLNDEDEELVEDEDDADNSDIADFEEAYENEVWMDLGGTYFFFGDHSVILDVFSEDDTKAKLTIDDEEFIATIDEMTGEINVYDDKKNETVFSGFVTAGGNMISGTFRGKPIKAQGVGD